MRSSSIHLLFGTTTLMLLSFDQASFADDALTAGSKSIVREFYTTVLINRHADAAPRFLRPGGTTISAPELHPTQPECADGIKRLHGYISCAFRAAASCRLQTRAPEYR